MGFFYSANKRAPYTGRRASAPTKVQVAHLNKMGCKGCTLSKYLDEEDRLDASGSNTPLFYVLGEAPSIPEVEDRKVFEGKVGTFLKRKMRKAAARAGRKFERVLEGFKGDIDSACRFHNTLKCCLPKGKSISQNMIESCRGYIEKDIASTKPEVIIGVGLAPLKWVIGNADGGMSAWRGRLLPVNVGGHLCWYYCVLHPSYVSQEHESVEHMFELDLVNLFRKIGEGKLSAPKVHTEEDALKGLELITTVPSILKALKYFSTRPAASIDLETYGEALAASSGQTALRPQSPNSAILTVALSDGRRHISFPIEHPGAQFSSGQKEKVYDALEKFCTTKGITKIAHNLVFDLSWLAYHLSDRLFKHRWGDTMAAAYALDERKGMLNLDVLCRLCFGINLKRVSKVEVSNLINEPLEAVLRYNALDAKYTYLLHKVLNARIKEEGLLKVYQHLIRSAVTSAAMTNKGVPINRRILDALDKELSAKVHSLERKVKKSPEAVKFRLETGRLFNPASANKDLPLMFRDILKRKEVIKEDGRVSTDKNVLESMKGCKLAKLILEWREVEKLRSTYVEGAKALIYPDKCFHSSINLLLTATGRLSFDSPNQQNFPKRKNKHIRNLVAAFKGESLLAADYTSIEARVLAMASEDQKFCEALWHGHDIHMYWAEVLADRYPRVLDWTIRNFGVDEDDHALVMKTLRAEIKNRWVFPLFYGSAASSCARNLDLPSSVADDLYGEFWSEHKGVRRWQEKTREFYNKNGYVETLTGRRRRGPLKGGEIINSPIQGTASDIVVDASNRLRREIVVPNFNVHDDLTFVLLDEELEELVPAIAEIMCTPKYDFIIVPVGIEMELGKKWGEMKEYRKWESHKDFGYPDRTSA